MISILFWNIAKNNIVDEVAKLAMQIAKDQTTDTLLCLGEHEKTDPKKVMTYLLKNDPGRTWWFELSKPTKRFLCIGCIVKNQFKPFLENGYGWPILLTRLSSTNNQVWQNYPIWFVHLPSPMGAENPSVYGLSEASIIYGEIESFESKNNTNHTIVIGDFNMTPFATGMVSPRGLNAAPCQLIAGEKYRTVNRKNYYYFYNPMWELLGNRTAKQQPGSFYKIFNDNSTKWHLWDQVLVRPNLMDKIASNSPNLIRNIDSTPLISKKGVIVKKISDHLPIEISIKI